MSGSLLRAAQSVCSWLPGYLEVRLRRPSSPPRRVWLAIADHFEPFWHGADEQTALRRVQLWRQKWPEIAARHRDSAGRPPRYTFFYPEEEYRPHLLDLLAEMVQDGIADVEVHIHHDGEGEQNFVDRMSRFTETLFHRHGLLRKQYGKIAFGFIHGNWALDNSRPDGRWCGLNNELILLRDLGCFADFTLPSAPEATQTRMVNRLYWATDDVTRPKSHDTGVPVTVGGSVAGDLMMIPGPLGFNWRGRRRLLLPSLETGELAAYAPVSRHRLRLWLRLAPRLGNDIFIKLYGHGAQEKNSEALLGDNLDSLFEILRTECSRRGMNFYCVSPWKMWQVIDAIRRQEDALADLASTAAGRENQPLTSKHFLDSTVATS